MSPTAADAAAAAALTAAGAAAGAWARSWLARRRARARLPTPATAAGDGNRAVGPAWPAGLPGSPGAVAAAGVAVVTGAAGAVAVLGPLVLVVGSLAGVALPVVVRVRRRAERRRLRRMQMPAALDRLAAALRSGSPVPLALLEAGAAVPPPVGSELVALGREADAGRAVAEVLDGWSRRHDDAGTRLASTALTLAATVGGTPGHAVDGVAATLRERVDLADERRALAAQARLSALVLAVAPLAFAVLLGAADGAAASFLLGTPAGWACLGAGLALDGAGAWWMARLTRGPET